MMVIFSRILWAHLKKNWQLILAIVFGIVGLLLFKRSQNGFLEQVKKIQDAHDVEIKKINAARDEERAAHEANLRQLQKVLADVQRQYDDAKIELDRKKRAEIADIVKKYGNDPQGLADRLSSVTGFKVVLPEEQR